MVMINAILYQTPSFSIQRAVPSEPRDLKPTVDIRSRHWLWPLHHVLRAKRRSPCTCPIRHLAHSCEASEGLTWSIHSRLGSPLSSPRRGCCETLAPGAVGVLAIYPLRQVGDCYTTKTKSDKL